MIAAADECLQRFHVVRTLVDMAVADVSIEYVGHAKHAVPSGALRQQLLLSGITQNMRPPPG